MVSTKKIKIKEQTLDQSPTEGEAGDEKKLFKTDGQLTVDVYETNADFVVLSTVAGVIAKDIELVIDKDMLVIKGCRTNPGIENDKNYFYQECYWGPFSRKVILPENIKIADVQAEFDKGLLVVRFPKSSGTDKKDISIKES